MNDDGVDNFINESESASFAGSAVLKGPNGESLNDEEQRMRKLEKKEMERIANRFKVITPQEFEKNLSLIEQAAGFDKNRPAADSWCGNNATGQSASAPMQGVTSENGGGENDLQTTANQT